MMATHHKASFWPHAVGDSLDPAIRKEDGVLPGNLGYIREPSESSILQHLH